MLARSPDCWPGAFQRQFWRNYRQAAQVRRLGILDAQQKKDFFAGIDIFAMPSRSDSFGLVFLEAWANGVPNVAYRAGGVAGVIRHEIDGLLSKCGDIAALADALGQLSKDALLRRKLGESGRERLAQDYKWSDKLALVERVYTDLVGEFETKLARSASEGQLAGAPG